MSCENKPKSWARRPREGEEAFAAFLAYRDMGAARTLDRVSREHAKSMPALKVWSARWGWVERSRAWDNFVQSARDRVAAMESAKWERRRLAALEEGYQLSQKLKAKAQRMLAFPLIRTTSDDGKTVIEPAKWNFMTAAVIARTAMEIEASILGAVTKPVEECTDDELRAISDADLDLTA